VKKVLLLLLPVVLLAYIVGCSKDHEAPTFSKFKSVTKPTNVVATYDPSTDQVNVTWNMNKMDNIIDFYITVSDSMDFNSINLLTQPIGTIDKTCSFSVKDFIPDTTKNVVLYFNISALYNSETLRNFIGPFSDTPDSALVVRK